MHLNNGRQLAFKRDLWQKELKQKQELLDYYYAQETKMLSGDAQSYNIGSRSVTKYSADLNTIRSNIDDLEKRIKELQYLLHGIPLRKRKSIVPRDK